SDVDAGIEEMPQDHVPEHHQAHERETGDHHRLQRLEIPSRQSHGCSMSARCGDPLRLVWQGCAGDASISIQTHVENTLPGFMMLTGSMARLSSRISPTDAAPSSSTRKSCLCNP